MKTTIQNDRFIVVIDSKGAEINSFKDKASGTSYIWDGDASVWKFHAPVLFPHVGRILDGYMTYRGVKYSLKVNGFSRDMEHSLVASTPTSADYELTECEYTKDKYPWHFSLKTHYEVTDNSLKFTTTVTNTDSVNITFSLGSHSAFCAPRNTDPSGTSISDYQIEFQKREPLTSVVCTDTGYLDTDDSGKIRTVPYNEATPGVIALSDKGFGNGHFFTGFSSEWVGLRNKKDNSLVKVNTCGYSYIMIWQNSGDPRFVCIEPWQGTPDSIKTDHTWENKGSLITLAPKASFTNDQSITIN